MELVEKEPVADLVKEEEVKEVVDLEMAAVGLEVVGMGLVAAVMEREVEGSVVVERVVVVQEMAEEEMVGVGKD